MTIRGGDFPERKPRKPRLRFRDRWHRGDDLDTARGITFALLVAVAFWVMVGVVVGFELAK